MKNSENLSPIRRAFANNPQDPLSLSSKIDGFASREAQVEMALAVGDAIDKSQQLIIEAPTGTGKTFAYLVPALLAKQKTIISTGSKNLQDQLYNRDLPTMVKALNFTGTTALLKGRANYLCRERLERVQNIGVLGKKELLRDLKKIILWNTKTPTGDFSECTDIGEDSPLISQLTSTKESCLGKECAHYDQCYVYKAREKAINADLVVVNHHLFFADMEVKNQGFAELIPSAKVIIFDEAHQVPDIATQYFSDSLTSRQLFTLSNDLEVLYRTELKDLKQLSEISNSILTAAQDFRLALGEYSGEKIMRTDWRLKYQKPEVQKSFALLISKLNFALEVIKNNQSRSSNLDNLAERVRNFLDLLERLSDNHITGYCYWAETMGKGFGLHITPLSIHDKMHARINKYPASWIFTSATLEVNNSFSYFSERLGINGKELKLSSPFDYPNQALLYVPRYLPLQNNPETASKLGEMLLPIIEANQGRCFVLCTSYSMMHDLAQYFSQNSQLKILLQGEKPKAQLLDTFVSEDNCLLVATSSFWEGVDVRGDNLSLVIIDKLPFTSPDDPLMKARIDDCKLQGKNPFNTMQIPEAVIALKQGVGRLIRAEDDRGVIIICDNRLVMKNYGQKFLTSLPNARRTRNVQNVVKFINNIRNKTKIN